MQEVWKAKLDWDSNLPDHFQKQWTSYCQELDSLKSFRIARCFFRPPHSSSQDCEYELHGFCDASEVAYAACTYIRTIDQYGQSVVTLMAAKTKVAAVKKETIPRLELCGGVLLSKLIKTIQDSLKTVFRVIHCWTDSTIVLGWLTSTHKLPVFVDNRVRKIEALVSSENWHHVSGDENPADPASRGISASSLVSHQLWLNGPSWLATASFPSNQISMITSTIEPSPISDFINNCSSYTKMKRVVGYCIRFTNNCRVQRKHRKTGTLSVHELVEALTRVVCCIQLDSFKEEIGRCVKNEIVKSNVKFLSPFIDTDGILRVGGRLRLSAFSFQKKHPILLPRIHNFTYQVARYYHLSHLHAAPQLLLAAIRDQFWIIRGPDLAKEIVKKCLTCHRQSSTTQTQIMGQLPLPRVMPARLFSQCGVDYAGPFYLCLRGGRNPLTIKSYISVFICMITRAVHLELVSDLSTPAFTGALTRFLSRRGMPSDIYCDGGKNFEGTKNEMKEIRQFLQSNAHKISVSDFSAEKGVKFHFNPPFSPHHGGLWEAAVKSMKHHLKRIVEAKKLTIEEFSTLLTQVEACLNSRPLTQMTTDPNDFSVLTPGHFLIGDSLTALPQLDLTPLKLNRLSRWQAVQQMYQHFWRRWQSEYISRLQSHHKWIFPQSNVDLGMLVLIRDDNPNWGPLKWKLGRISATYPGSDGKIRVCDVKTSDGKIFKRPIVKLSPLPIYQ